uniref:Thioredoxin-like 3-2, chloroplastic n=1 Tax=Anthurium amnicola TaxID=1678845 RepID=A0A1D1ZEJ0_9ARAE
MPQVLRLPLQLPSSILLRRRPPSKGRGRSSSFSSNVLPSSRWTSFSSRPFRSLALRSKIVAVASASSSWSIDEDGPPNEGKGDRHTLVREEVAPASMELETVSGEEQFDEIIAEARQLEVPVIMVWMANWCRKCIYLKPKLEKLAIDYYPSFPLLLMQHEANGPLLPIPRLTTVPWTLLVL